MTAASSRAELQADMADVSELFDPVYYAAANPTVAARTGDLLKHFCEHGWRELRKPNRDFDVWWYWVNHLDPASDEVNPLAHYARIGRAAGLSTRPETMPTGRGATLPTDRSVRRACLFAGFDADFTIDETVLIYLRELSKFADVFCLFDNYLPATELHKVQEVVTEAWAVRHGAYDFGSYRMLARDLVGWERLSAYDEVLFVNDSCYLLGPLDDVFSKMNDEACDWWGMQATKGIAMTRAAPTNQFTEPIPLSVVRQDLLSTFEDDAVYDFLVGSYFLAFRRQVVNDPVFRKLLESVKPQPLKRAIIQKYEIGLTHLLIGHGYVFSTYVPALYPFHPVYTMWAFELIKQGMPLLKRYFLYNNHYDTPGLARWKERVVALAPDAPVRMFEDNLVRTAPADRLHRSFAIDTDEDGTVRVPREISGKVFVKMDRKTPKRGDWWVFAVDPITHVLPENSRAVFDRVAHDTDITKIILTRTRRVELSGKNVVSEPLLSPEGREHLLGAGVVFLADQPTATLGVQVQPSLHHVIAVRGGLQLLKQGRLAALPRHPGADPPPASGPLQMLHRVPKLLVTAILTASDVDQVAEISSQWPARYSNSWRTGIPRHDYLLNSGLPADLVQQEEQLRQQLNGRRLVLFAPVLRRTGSAMPPYLFNRSEVERLVGWACRHDAVIGVREPIGDLERCYSAAFGDLALDLSPRRFASSSAVLRCADVLVTDYSGAALDFTLTGRPVVSFASDLDTVADRLLYDLDHLFPGFVCREFDALTESLDKIFDPPGTAATRQYNRVRDLMIDHRDGQNAARVVDRVHRLLEGVSDDSR